VNRPVHGQLGALVAAAQHQHHAAVTAGPVQCGRDRGATVAAVDDLGGAGTLVPGLPGPGDDLGTDPGRVLRPRIVVRDHHHVGTAGRGGTDRGTFARVAVTAGPDHHDDRGILGGEGGTGRGDGLGGVGEVDVGP